MNIWQDPVGLWSAALKPVVSHWRHVCAEVLYKLFKSHCTHFTTNDPPRYRLFFLQLFKLTFIRSFKKLTVVWFSRTGMTRAAGKIQLLLDSFFFKTIATITHSVIILVVPNTLCHGNQTKIAHSCSHADFNTHSPDSGKLKSWGSSTHPHRRTMLGSCYLFHKCFSTGNPKTKLETDTTLNNIFENMDNRGWSFFNSHVLNSL